MKICGLQKLSLLDYPGFTASTVFTGGCNLRCPFCHNALLVTSQEFDEVISEDEFFSFLNKRTGLLDGICISGGEPLLHDDIEDFISKIKILGFSVKLDTNGCFPDKLENLISKNLVDYIAMDIKNSLEKYPITVGIDGFDTGNIQKSIKIIMNSGIDYEFRTTLVKELHTKIDIEKISKLITGANNYYLQTFVDSGNLIKSGFSPFSPEESLQFLKIASVNVKNTQIRGQ